MTDKICDIFLGSSYYFEAVLKQFVLYKVLHK